MTMGLLGIYADEYPGTDSRRNRDYHPLKAFRSLLLVSLFVTLCG
jgi:hypothetical protein